LRKRMTFSPLVIIGISISIVISVLFWLILVPLLLLLMYWH
jgi:hypothetical protein